MVAEAIKDVLEMGNHTVEWTTDGLEGFERLSIYQYDVAILDWSLPNMDGVDICKTYRSKGGSIPVLMLTGKNNVSDKVKGLDAGADDYLTKPFSVPELQARLRALLRRPSTTLPEVLTVGDLTVDPKLCKARRGEREISLLPKEMAVLEFLMRHREQIFSVSDLLNRVWSSESESTEDAVRQCITRLRKKIDAEGEKSIIVTVKGLGYRIEG